MAIMLENEDALKTYSADKMLEIIKDIVIPGFAVVGASVGGAISIYIYYVNSKLERAQWLHSLFEKFFCQAGYNEVRQLLDYDQTDDATLFRKAISDRSDIVLEEKLVNYLNFFEFIASLWLLKQINIKEIRMMFDYYIQRLGDHDYIVEYLEKEGFEGLISLIAKVQELRSKE